MCDNYALIIKVVGKGQGAVSSNIAGINCPGDCDELYVYGTSISLTVTPDSGSKFTGWSGDGDCNDGVVDITTDLTCEANFYRFPWPMFMPAMRSNSQP